MEVKGMKGTLTASFTGSGGMAFVAGSSQGRLGSEGRTPGGPWPAGGARTTPGGPTTWSRPHTRCIRHGADATHQQ